MQVDLAFSKQGLSIDLPANYHYLILNTKSAKALDDPAEAIVQVLHKPTHGLPLEEMSQGKKSAAIIICDITRPTPNRLILPSILACLQKAGILKSDITILIGTGLHRSATDEELQILLGEQVVQEYSIVNHNARSLNDHCYLGTTSAGTPVYIDRRFIEADIRLSIGLIEPHLMLGFSGGRKLIAPGIAGEPTIKAIHHPRFMRHPLAVEGSIANNPLHQELIEIAGLARHDFIVDVVLNRDRQIAAVFGGTPEPTHLQGVAFVQQSMLQEIPHPVDGVITTSAGFPLDLTFYQVIKGISAGLPLLKQDGNILLFAACEEGVGSKEFAELLVKFPDAESCLAHFSQHPVQIDQWQLEKLALAHRKAKLFYYVPGLSPRYQQSLWGKTFNDPQTAISAFLHSLPSPSTIAILPEGPYVLARTQLLQQPFSDR